MFTPNTSVKLLNVPFSSDGVDTVFFSSVADQQAYFSARVKVDCGDSFNYVKKDNTIVVKGTPEQLYMVNYVMYKNNNYLNKWFYAFVTQIEWASSNSTRLYLRTDPIQTWLFELVLYKSFIVRQHSETDEPGDNIQPEPFNVSRTKYSYAGEIDCTPDWLQIYATSTPTGVSVNGGYYGGIYSGCGQAFFDTVSPSNTLSKYVENGTADAVSRIQQACSLGDPVGPKSEVTFNFKKYPDAIDGYTPKNKKLLSGEFCHSFIAGFGQLCEFIPEFCLGSGCSVKVLQDITSGSLYFYVPNYGLTVAGNDNVILGFSVVVPESSWSYNRYKNEYNLHNASNSMLVERMKETREAKKIESPASTFTSAVALFGGILTGSNPDVTVGSKAVEAASYIEGYDEITQTLQAIGESYNAPATGGLATSNVFIASGQNKVNYGWLVPDKRFAESYDSFLTVYGYAQNKFAVPNLHARRSFTYVKVSELHAGGELPDADLLEIKSMFTRGIYFWDPAATIGDFSQDNSVM